MRRYVAIVVVPLISIGVDQASGIYYSSDPQGNIYAEHLDSVCNSDDVQQMVSYLNKLTHDIIRKTSVILYISPNTITHHIWAPVLKNLITKNVVHLFCVNECHYITCAGRHCILELFTNIRFIVGHLWNKFPMLFCSATMHRSSMYHTLLMLHP